MDEQQPVTRNAITYIEDQPHYELLAEDITVRISASDASRFLCVHLRPYTPAEMKDTLKQLKGRIRDAGPSLIQEDADPTSLRRLCDLTFQRLSHVRLPDGSEPTREQQQQWLQQNPRLKARVVEEAFATVLVLRDGDTASADDVFELVLGDSGARVKYLYVLFSPDKGKLEPITITHHFEPETENDYQTYDRASRRETDKRTGFTTVDVDYEALEKLYNRTVIKIDGMVLDGLAATAANRDKWLARVPFWQKLIALNTRFDDISKKNIG